MSRQAQDSFISDDEEEVCPLCVEELDISDKGFKPCPCGYQVCQFCYNNIRSNPQLNGRCPGCRRPYDDQSIEYRVITPEEWKQDQAKQTRKDRERKQRDRERKESVQASRKHLSGMRVIQKNLVYVVGLNPSIPTDDLHNTLRGDQFFGQYGRIQKIVINRRNGGSGGIGVYVTYHRKEDAERCIQAVDGSMNEGKVLHAAYGTTKYCSYYLRNQPCPNPNCMFLHEPGEEADSYTRQDLSTIQHAAKQDELSLSPPQHPSTTSTHHHPAKTTIGSNRQKTMDSSIPDADATLLPATASWATKSSVKQPSKVKSMGSPQTPAVTTTAATATTAAPAVSASASEVSPRPPSSAESTTSVSGIKAIVDDVKVKEKIKDAQADPTLAFFDGMLQTLSQSSFRFSFSQKLLSSEVLKETQMMPPLFAFSLVTTGDELSESNTSDGNQSAPGPIGHNRHSSRHTFGPDRGQNLQHVQEQQRIMRGGRINGPPTQSGGISTPPPPGLQYEAAGGSGAGALSGSSSNLSRGDSQSLLEHLMNGSYNGSSSPGDQRSNMMNASAFPAVSDESYNFQDNSRR